MPTDPVFEEAVQHAVLALDRRPGDSVELVEVAQGLFGSKVLHEVRKIPNAAYQDRRPHLAAGKDARVFAVEQLFDDGRRHVP